MKYLLLSAVWLITTPLCAQTKSVEEKIQNAISIVVNDVELNRPRTTYRNHDTLQNRMLQEIISGNDTLIFSIVKTTGFSSFMFVKNHHYQELIKLQDIQELLADLRKSFSGRENLSPDLSSTDTLFGDISRSEVWNAGLPGAEHTELTVMFINHQLTNFLVRKREE